MISTSPLTSREACVAREASIRFAAFATALYFPTA